MVRGPHTRSGWPQRPLLTYRITCTHWSDVENSAWFFVHSIQEGQILSQWRNGNVATTMISVEVLQKIVPFQIEFYKATPPPKSCHHRMWMNDWSKRLNVIILQARYSAGVAWYKSCTVQFCYNTIRQLPIMCWTNTAILSLLFHMEVGKNGSDKQHVKMD